MWTGRCGTDASGFANAMLIAGIVTLIQLWTIGPVGSRLPIVMGTSSGFIGVSKGIVASCWRRCFSLWSDYGSLFDWRSDGRCSGILLKNH